MGLSLDQVWALVRAHSAADGDEAVALARLRLALDAAEDALSKGCFAPGHVTCSAFVVSPDGAQLLLIHHRALDLWIQPGGHVDPADASPEGAALRELWEETGATAVLPLFDGLLDVDVHDVPDGLKGQPGHLHLDLRFAFQAQDWAVQAASDAYAASWFPLGTLDTVRTDASVRRAARRLVARLGARAPVST